MVAPSLFTYAPADPALVREARRRLTRGIEGARGEQVVVDPSGHLVGLPGLNPLARVCTTPRRPDVVARLDDGSLAAVVASDHPDLDGTLDRAEQQRPIAHYVALALGRDPVSAVRRRAEQIGVGLYVAGQPAPLALPARDVAPPMAAQLNDALDAVAAAAPARQFHYNIPTHSLVWTLAVHPETPTTVNDARGRLSDYPVSEPRGLSGAILLGLVVRSHDELLLTDLGRSVRETLGSVPAWARTHADVKASGRRLIDIHPDAVSVARRALAELPAARFVSDTLTDAGGEASARDLITLATQRDPVFGPALFLNPDAVASLSRPNGTVDAHAAEGHHVRVRVAKQFKSLLLHLGVLAPGPLAAVQGGTLDLDRTVWTLDRPLAA
ncbi:MAG: hypothetical protein SangKO_100090 [Sandaracinaceae bacterium]